MKFWHTILIIVGILVVASYFQIDWKKEWKETKFKNTIEEPYSPYFTYTSGKNKNKNFIVVDGKILTTTILNEHDLKIQNETGCFQNCHKEFK